MTPLGPPLRVAHPHAAPSPSRRPAARPSAEPHLPGRPSQETPACLQWHVFFGLPLSGSSSSATFFRCLHSTARHPCGCESRGTVSASWRGPGVSRGRVMARIEFLCYVMLCYVMQSWSQRRRNCSRCRCTSAHNDRGPPRCRHLHRRPWRRPCRVAPCTAAPCRERARRHR